MCLELRTQSGDLLAQLGTKNNVGDTYMSVVDFENA